MNQENEYNTIRSNKEILYSNYKENQSFHDVKVKKEFQGFPKLMIM